MEENTERNKAIVKDKETMSWTQLARKYNLSNNRLQRIVERTKIKYGSELKVTQNV
jgi:Mor family transcriptional regulator